MIKQIPKPISGGLILSYKCSAECLHCMYSCSPKWSGDWISQEDLERILTQLADRIEPSPYGSGMISLNYGLHFTGGEPFLNYELLCKSVEISRELNIPSTFVETNCYWCTNDKSTAEKMRLLKEKGLKGIMVSVNPFYLEYVPFERTERAIRIGREVFGENLMVYQLEYYRRFKEWGIKDRVSFEGYLRIERKEDFARNVEFFLMGRAPYKVEGRPGELFPRYRASHFFNEPCRPPFLRSWHNHFDNYGNYIPGYCGGISLGDCRDLDGLLKEGVEVEEYPVLGFLMNEDLEGLFQFAEDFGYGESKGGYLSKCHLCVDIRKHLVARGEFKELEPKEFYLRLE
ncbi:MAG: 4Fe-4S cluster-binding domain-containing protein [bacterium]